MKNTIINYLDEQFEYITEDGISMEIQVWLRDIKNVKDYTMSLDGQTYVLVIEVHNKDKYEIEKVFEEFIHSIEYQDMTIYFRENSLDTRSYTIVSATNKKHAMKIKMEFPV